MNTILDGCNFLFMLVVVWVCVVLESTLLHEFFGMYKPALYIVILAYFALNRFALEGGILAYVMGYVIEINSGAPFGLYSVVLVLTFYAAKGISEGFFIKTPWAEMLLVGVISLLYKIIFLGITSIYGSVTPILKISIISGVFIAFLNLLLTPLGFWVLKQIDERLGKIRPFKTGTQEHRLRME
ncbi:MAG: rod shape-determining protein MreD [Deltaproteobacteria bacterium RIFCSPHIGHO2_02_FULL_40_11]|nr:MAG: rod shape-determining protein MreD [Deltaproteobacteria bacterium RIFCSPHIGHO2_02_FULL_40_11]